MSSAEFSARPLSLNKLIENMSGAALLAAGITASAAATASGAQALMQTKLNKKNRQWQEKMRKEQWEHDQQVTEDNRRYNEEIYEKYQSPTALRAALQKAGYNPALAYGGSGFDAGGLQVAEQDPSSTPAFEDTYGANGVPALFANGISSAQAVSDVILKDSQARTNYENLKTLAERNLQELDILESTAAIKRIGVITSDEERKIAEYSGKISKLEFEIKRSTKRYAIDNYIKQNSLFYQEILNAGSTRTLNEKKGSYYDAYVSKAGSEITKNLMGAALMMVQMETEEHRQALFDANATYFYSEAAVNAQEERKIAWQAFNEFLDGFKDCATLGDFIAKMSADASAAQWAADHQDEILRLQTKQANAQIIQGYGNMLQSFILTYIALRTKGKAVSVKPTEAGQSSGPQIPARPFTTTSTH